MENSNGKNRSRRFSVIKHRHKTPSVSRVHRQDIGSQNRPGFPGFCRIIIFFMDYWDMIEKQSQKRKNLQFFKILASHLPGIPGPRRAGARAWRCCSCTADIRNCVGAGREGGNSRLCWDPITPEQR